MLTALYPWQTSLWQQLCQQLRTNRLPHALLVSGVKGLAKNSFSQHIVASVLCLNRRDDQSSCGHCHSCQLLNAGSHPDHIEIRPEETGKQIKIDQIRNLRDKQQLTPSVSKWKTIIISPADNMNVSSSNSLLKLLEEPQQNTVLILITGHPEKLPITVKSRCQNYHLASPTSEQAFDWLTNNTDNKIDSETSAKLLQLAKGAPLAVVDMLRGGMAEQYLQVEQDFKLILQNSANPMTLTAAWLKYDLVTVLNQLQYMIRDRMIKSFINPPTITIDQAGINLYWKISDCIVQVIKLVSSQNNINNSLLIEDFIVSVMRIANSNATNQ
jgi:DNA polymerase-3 subunit delta'